MALTTSDLLKIEHLIKPLEIRLSNLETEFSGFKAQLSTLTDLVLEIHKVVTTELPLHSARLQDHETRIVTLEKIVL